MSFREFLSKTSIANIVAGASIILGLVYAFYIRDTNLMTFIVGAGVGYLFSVKKRGE